MEDNLDDFKSDLEGKYLEFLGCVENAFPKLDISGVSMMQRMYCGLRFTEGATRALTIFKLMDGKSLLDEVGKRHIINWLQSMILDLEKL